MSEPRVIDDVMPSGAIRVLAHHQGEPLEDCGTLIRDWATGLWSCCPPTSTRVVLRKSRDEALRALLRAWTRRRAARKLMEGQR